MQKITVSKEFKTAFNLCMKHYECTAEEIEFEKQRVRKNFKDAQICYSSIAKTIRKILNIEENT